MHFIPLQFTFISNKLCPSNISTRSNFRLSLLSQTHRSNTHGKLNVWRFEYIGQQYISSSIRILLCRALPTINRVAIPLGSAGFVVLDNHQRTVASRRGEGESGRGLERSRHSSSMDSREGILPPLCSRTDRPANRSMPGPVRDFPFENFLFVTLSVPPSPSCPSALVYTPG